MEPENVINVQKVLEMTYRPCKYCGHKIKMSPRGKHQGHPMQPSMKKQNDMVFVPRNLPCTICGCKILNTKKVS